MERAAVFMPGLKHGLKPNLSTRLIGRVKLADFLEMPEKEFAGFIKKLEDNPLFRKLAYPDKKENKIISYGRLFNSGLSKHFLELKEYLVPSSASFDVQLLLSKKRKIVKTIKKLGIDKFKLYFLHNESNMTNEDISPLCGLEKGEAESITALMNEISVNSEFYHPSGISPAYGGSYHKVASIEKNSSGKNVIAYFSPQLARGKYVINRGKLELLKARGFFTQKDIKRIDRLIKRLEIVNSRKLTVHNVINSIIERQSDYFRSGRIEDLAPLSQKETALELNINPSLVCRAIKGRSMDTPWQEEIPLTMCFPSGKDIRKNLVKAVIDEEKRPVKDRGISNALKKKYNVRVSPHLVTICRNELKLPPANKRNQEQ